MIRYLTGDGQTRPIFGHHFKPRTKTGNICMDPGLHKKFVLDYAKMPNMVVKVWNDYYEAEDIRMAFHAYAKDRYGRIYRNSVQYYVMKLGVPIPTYDIKLIRQHQLELSKALAKEQSLREQSIALDKKWKEASKEAQLALDALNNSVPKGWRSPLLHDYETGQCLYCVKDVKCVASYCPNPEQKKALLDNEKRRQEARNCAVRDSHSHDYCKHCNVADVCRKR